MARSPEVVVHGGLRPPMTGWLGWVTTTDHKRIGILYLVTTFIFFVVGGVEALLMRLQLAQRSSDLIAAENYNALFTMHGTTMIFLFIVPVMSGFANYFVPPGTWPSRA